MEWQIEFITNTLPTPGVLQVPLKRYTNAETAVVDKMNLPNSDPAAPVPAYLIRKRRFVSLYSSAGTRIIPWRRRRSHSEEITLPAWFAQAVRLNL